MSHVSSAAEPAQGADPAQVTAVVAAARRARPGAGGVVVVAIDGRSGAGKSTLAAAVARRLGAPVVRMDGLYPGWDGLAAGVDLLTAHVLEPLSRGEQANVPTWSWVHDRPGPLRAVPTAPVVVVEGCGALATPPELVQLAVWLDAADDLRHERALARDGATYRPRWERWADQERRLLAEYQPRSRADLVMSTDH